MNDYEERRQAKIKQNQKLLAQLDIQSVVPPPASRSVTKRSSTNGTSPASKKRKLQQDTTPSRTSARIAAAPERPRYNDDGPDIKAVSLPRSAGRRAGKSSNGVKSEEELGSKHISNPEPLVPIKDVDEIVADWTRWEPDAEPPTRDPDTNEWVFKDAEDFRPNKSPEEMLREGAFGGAYYRPLRSKKLGITVSGDWESDLPTEWLKGLNIERFVTSPEYDPDVNKFKVSCGQSIEEWEAAGWIDHAHDVRGWFQWYIRFFRGRRCADDDRQISRWRKCVGPTGRWRRMLLKRYRLAGVRSVWDDGEDEDPVEVSPVMHQTCHHWAYEVRQEALEKYWASGT
ncbi:hypothetical protein MBLNU230_g7711t1 [Neophaeotheca triangularis]